MVTRPEKSYMGMRGNALIMAFTEPLGQGILFLTTPFWSLYALDLGASLTLIGLLSLVQGLVRISLQAPVGYLTDKVGRKRLVVLGGFIASLAPLAYYFATRWEHLLIGVTIEAFTNIALPARQAMFADAIDSEKRATAFASIHTLFSVFSTIMPIASGYLLNKVGFLPGMRTAYLIAFVVMLLTSFARAAFLVEDLDINERAPSRPSLRGTFFEMFDPLFSIKALRVILLSAFLYSMAQGIVRRYSVIYAIDVVGISMTQWGLVSGAMGALGIFTKVPTGWLIDKISRKTCILISYVTRPIFLIGFALSRSFPQLLLVKIVDNTFSFVQQPALEALVIDLTPKKKRGRTYGAMNIIPGIASTISPMIGAFIWEAIGAEWAFYTSALFAATAFVVLSTFLHLPDIQNPKARAHVD